MLDPELKTRWTKALRDDGYTQGKGSLHDQHTDAYCCLGVLCDIEGLDFDDGLYNFGDGIWKACELPDGYYGLEKSTLRILMRMNDGHDEYEDHPKSFEEIADYIEENL